MIYLLKLYLLTHWLEVATYFLSLNHITKIMSVLYHAVIVFTTYSKVIFQNFVGKIIKKNIFVSPLSPFYFHFILIFQPLPGPLVTMMGKMVKNMIYFVVLLAVVLMSFGVSRQAIRHPGNEPTWGLIKEVSSRHRIS